MKDGTIIGDPANVNITQHIIMHGWHPPNPVGHFDFLPLLLESSGFAPELFELPQDLRHTIHFKHDDYPALEALKLQWHCVPALSCVSLDLGGLIYSAAPFNGWFMGTEISRNLLDIQRYNCGPAMAKALGFSMKNSSLWRDEVQLVLNKAILASFMREGTSVIDHHSASDSFMEFMETQIEEVGWCPADWIWITPPAGGSMTKVFHQEMINWCSKPAYREQTILWLGWKEKRVLISLQMICVIFVGIAMWTQNLFQISRFPRELCLRKKKFSFGKQNSPYVHFVWFGNGHM
jgi:nitric-oxide synthase